MGELPIPMRERGRVFRLLILLALASGCGGERVVSVEELCRNQDELVGEVLNFEVTLSGDLVFLHTTTLELCAPDDMCCNDAGYVYALECPSQPTIGFVPPPTGTVDARWICNGREPPCEPECPSISLTARGELSPDVRSNGTFSSREFALAPE